MNILTTVARFLLGLIFLVFGLNGFLHFLSMPAPTGLAGQFMGALFVSRFLLAVFLIQLLAAVLLLVNRYVPTESSAFATMRSFHSFRDDEVQEWGSAVSATNRTLLSDK